MFRPMARIREQIPDRVKFLRPPAHIHDHKELRHAGLWEQEVCLSIRIPALKLVYKTPDILIFFPRLSIVD